MCTSVPTLHWSTNCLKVALVYNYCSNIATLSVLTHIMYFSCFSELCMFLKWTHAGDIICVTDSLAEKTIANLPGEHARALGLGFGLFFAPFFLFFKNHLVLWDLFDHRWRGNPWFGPTDLARFDAASLIVPATNNDNVERQWTVLSHRHKANFTLC